MKHEKFKVTPLERAWILYDVGNSAFVLMIATLVPIFFNALAEAGGVSKVDYLAYWGYASSIVTVVTAILGPILGTLADTKGFKKPIFMLCLFVGVIGCCAMGLAGTWLAFLVIFIIAKIGYSGSLVFYDSMLGDVTTPERMDMVSSRGYAWGYIGSCVPFVVCLALVLGSSVVGLSQMTALSIALVITAVWWLVVTLPLLKKYRQINYVEVEQHAIRQSFVRIGQTLKHLPQDKQVVLALAGAKLPQPYVHFRAAIGEMLPFMHAMPSIQLVIVAGADEDYERELRRQVAEYGLANVTVLGYVNAMAELMGERHHVARLALVVHQHIGVRGRGGRMREGARRLARAHRGVGARRAPPRAGLVRDGGGVARAQGGFTVGDETGPFGGRGGR